MIHRELSLEHFDFVLEIVHSCDTESKLQHELRARFVNSSRSRKTYDAS
jgi:hypothetical protein